MGWEIFSSYQPAPIERCPARYATPPLEFELDYGDPVKVTHPFVSLSGSKVGVDPSATFTAHT
eukprot:1165755-Pleurochrysis_carterae.AAC.1